MMEDEFTFIECELPTISFAHHGGNRAKHDLAAIVFVKCIFMIQEIYTRDGSPFCKLSSRVF